MILTVPIVQSCFKLESDVLLQSVKHLQPTMYNHTDKSEAQWHFPEESTVLTFY